MSGGGRAALDSEDFLVYNDLNDKSIGGFVKVFVQLSQGRCTQPDPERKGPDDSFNTDRKRRKLWQKKVS